MSLCGGVLRRTAMRREYRRMSNVIDSGDFHDGFRFSYADFRGHCREGVLSGLLVDSVFLMDDLIEKP